MTDLNKAIELAEKATEQLQKSHVSATTFTNTHGTLVSRKDFDRVFSAHGNRELDPETHGRNIIASAEELKAAGHITGDQRDSINSTIRAAGARGEKFKLGSVLNKIYDNGHAATHMVRNLAYGHNA